MFLLSWQRCLVNSVNYIPSKIRITKPLQVLSKSQFYLLNLNCWRQSVAAIRQVFIRSNIIILNINAFLQVQNFKTWNHKIGNYSRDFTSQLLNIHLHKASSSQPSSEFSSEFESVQYFSGPTRLQPRGCWAGPWRPPGGILTMMRMIMMVMILMMILTVMKMIPRWWWLKWWCWWSSSGHELIIHALNPLHWIKSRNVEILILVLAVMFMLRVQYNGIWSSFPQELPKGRYLWNILAGDRPSPKSQSH